MKNQELHQILADYYCLYTKLQCYHWNIEGENFVQFHTMFGSLYEKASVTIDEIAEHIRTLGDKVPASLELFAKKSNLKSANENLAAKDMIKDIARDYELITSSMESYYQALSPQSVKRFLENKIDEHRKQSWFFKSILTWNEV